MADTIRTPAELRTRWPEIVGADLAPFVASVELDGPVVVVTVADPTHRSRLESKLAALDDRIRRTCTFPYSTIRLA